jgi:hypothetical protein
MTESVIAEVTEDALSVLALIPALLLSRRTHHLLNPRWAPRCS